MTDTATPHREPGTVLTTVGTVGFSAVAYVGFLVVFVGTVLFLADAVVPHTVDGGGPVRSTAAAVVVDVLLLGLFVVQHSVMARPWFKARWTRLVPPALERSAYVLVASAVLALLLWQWTPLPEPVWTVSGGGRGVLWVAYGIGWSLVVVSTFLIDHFELFGLHQACGWARGEAEAAPRFVTPLLYRLVRHPLMVGFLIAFWAAPTMTRGHLLFAALGSAYIVVAVRFEERDLCDALPEYREYAARTPRFVPAPRRWRDRSQPMQRRSA